MVEATLIDAVDTAGMLEHRVPVSLQTPVSIIVGTMTGGQGKTLISSLIVAAMLDEKRRTFTAVGMDAVGETANESRSKLEIAVADKGPDKLWGFDCKHSLTTMSIVATSERGVIDFRDGRILTRHLDKLAQLARKQSLVVDLGANLIDTYLEYVKAGDAKGKLLGREKISTTIVLPVTADAISQQRARGCKPGRRRRQVHPGRRTDRRDPGAR